MLNILLFLGMFLSNRCDIFATAARGWGPFRTGDQRPGWTYGPVDYIFGDTILGVPVEVFLPCLGIALILTWALWVTEKVTSK